MRTAALGRLKIPSLGLSVKVYEDESLESPCQRRRAFQIHLLLGRQCRACGHNRGVANHFGKIHTLEDGDKITYTTKLGTRTYEVFYVGQIEETDFSAWAGAREYDHADHLCPKCAGDALVRAGPEVT